MRRKTIKAKVSAALSASMALVMLAPAMPAYAANGDITFDFATLNPSVKWLSNKTISGGTPGSIIKGSAPLTGSGLETDSNDYVYMPFYKTSPTAGYDYNDATTFYGSNWKGLDLDGYKIDAWYNGPNGRYSQEMDRLDQTRYPYTTSTYYMGLKADTSKYYNINVTHVPANSNVFVPGIDGNTKGSYNNTNHSAADSAVNTLKYFQTNPITEIGGFKIVNTSLNDTVSIVNPTGSATRTLTDTNFTYNDGTVSGNAINRDVNIQYKYDVDTSKVFTLSIEDNIYQVDPTTGLATLVKNQVRKTEHRPTGFDVGTSNIKDDPNITANGMYMLVGSTVGTTTAPTVKLSATDDPKEKADVKYVKDEAVINRTGNNYSNLNKYLIHNTKNASKGLPAGQAPTGVDPNEIKVDASNKVIGHMPNQGVTVTYNYVLNPNFRTHINVIYQDADGNNITDKVINKLGNISADPNTSTNQTAAALNTVYSAPLGTTGEQLVAYVNNASTSGIDIPAPKLDLYQPNPTIDAVNLPSWINSYTPTSVSSLNGSWSLGTNEKFHVGVSTASGAPSTSETLIVTYRINPSAVVGVQAETNTGGKLMVGSAEYDPGNINHVITRARENINATNNTYELTLKESYLPTPTPDPGFEFDHWQYDKDGNGFVDAPSSSPFDFTVTGIPSSVSNITIKALFKENPNTLNTYNFVSSDTHHVGLVNGSIAKLPNIDTSGNPRTLTFADLANYVDEAAGGITVASGYTVVWKDSSGAVVTPATDITSMNGMTFTAYAVPNTPVTPYNPIPTPSLDPTTGEPVIAIDPSNSMNPSGSAVIDARLNYVVTDNSGNVVAVIPGSDVLTNGANITGPFLTPGNTYNVYTALPSASVAVGMQIPTTGGVSTTPSPTTIPVAPTPQVTEDSANPGRASITVRPTAPNTEYALVDDNGNTVYPFTTPTNNSHGVGTVTFGNLDPGRTYHVVPRQTGSNDTPAQRQASGADLPVNTNNLGLTVNTFDVTVIANNAALPANFKINGQAETDINKLRNLAPGTTVEILAQPLDNASNTFSNWEVVSGLPSSSATTNARITFTMPNRPVKVQAMYSDGTSWDGNVYNDNISSGKSIGAVNPVINDTGRFRVVIDKNSVPTPIKNLIADTLTDTYSAVFLMNIKVQKFDTATNNWVDYTPAGGSINLDTTVETGALMSTREYTFHELATSSNAVSALSGDFENPSSTYPGQFDINLQSGKSYIFGYTTPVVYKVKIKDNRDNSLITNFTIRSTEVVNDKASLYSGSITGDYIDNNGITWHYEGLSTDKDTYQAYDPTLRVTSDETLYVFYSNDKVARAKAERDLTSAVNDARRSLRDYDANSQGRLTAQLAAAQAILDRINRKSSTAELQAALDALNALLPTLNLRNGGGGRGRGGRGGSGGGSGSAGRRAAAGQTAGLRVGQDGNWELLNPAEATANPDSSKWVFNLTAGGRVKGWAYLSYTYEGQTKSEWYHFGDDNIMDSGWFLDGNTWYYLSMNHNGFFGEMVKGWHHDGQDGRWYYLDANNGAMHTNWSKIGGEYYFLNPTAPAQTWFYDNATGRWNFGDVNSRPLGSMYQNENTPDGYHVNESGAWR